MASVRLPSALGASAQMLKLLAGDSPARPLERRFNALCEVAEEVEQRRAFGPAHDQRMSVGFADRQPSRIVVERPNNDLMLALIASVRKALLKGAAGYVWDVLYTMDLMIDDPVLRPRLRTVLDHFRSAQRPGVTIVTVGDFQLLPYACWDLWVNDRLHT